MKRIIITNSLIVAAVLLSFTAVLPVAALALPAQAQENRATVETLASTKKEVAQARLANAKLKACQNREKVINNIMRRMGDRGQKQIDLFTKIADKTTAFYDEKGKTLSTYETLVADVAAKKVVAQSAVDTTKTSVAEFACDGTDPKGAAASFKENLRAQNNALKAYKTAVKNLIVGVKSVQSTTSSTEKTEGGVQ